MKKIIMILYLIMIISFTYNAIAENILDLSRFSLDELIQLQEAIDQEINFRKTTTPSSEETNDDNSPLSTSFDQPINQTGFISLCFRHVYENSSLFVLSDDGSFNNFSRGKIEKLNWWDEAQMLVLRANTIGNDTVIYGIDNNGKMLINGNCSYKDEMDDWENVKILAISPTHSVAVLANGSLVSAGDYRNKECDVDNWSDIIDLQVGKNFTVGLKSNGTVVATGKNDYGQCNVSSWTDIVAISTGQAHTIGLKSDGTVVAAGCDKNDQCYVGRWKNVKHIFAYGSATSGLTVGVTSEGEILCTEKDHPAVSKNLGGLEDLTTQLPKDYRCPGAIAITADSRYIAIIDALGEINVWGWDHDHLLPAKPANPKAEYSMGECEGIAINYLKAHLKNPQSYQEHSITATKSDEAYLVVIDYSAMNGFGGYTRSMFYCLVDIKSGKIMAAY